MDEVLDRLYVARCMYANGLTYMSDAEYDKLMMVIKAEGIQLNPIYEDDPVPYESFSRVMGLDKDAVDKMLTGEVESALSSDSRIAHDFLAETESLSITPVFTFEDAYEWFYGHQGEEVVISAKVDGINTRRGYEQIGKKLKYIASLTRGRKSDPLDVTANMAKISMGEIDADLGQNLIVYSETVALQSAIEIINEKYYAEYTVPRGLAMAMMRVSKFEDEDYKYLKSLVFRVDYGEKLSDGLELAKKLGFDVVPYVFYTFEGESLAEFKVQMESIIRELKKVTDSWDIVTDGMVAEVNDRTRFSLADVSNNYSAGNLAMKIGLWQPGVYTSVVKGLDLKPQADRCTCVAIVEPVISKGGQTITRVNCFNPSVLFRYDILPGKEIMFEYKNETTVNLIMGGQVC